MVLRRYVLVSLAVLLGFSQGLAADEMLAPPAGESHPLTLGVALVFKDKPYRNFDDDEKIGVAPLVIYEGERFFFRGANFGWKFINRPDLEIAVRAELRNDGYDSGDASILSGMDDRDPTLDGGASLTWRPGTGKWGMTVVAVHDLTDEYDGYEARVSGFYQTRTENWSLKGSAGIVYQSDDLVDYYYGVRDTEEDIPSGRPAYSADAETNVRLQAVAAYAPADASWTFLFGVRYDFFGDEIKDSPIVGEDGQLTAVFGVGYRFN